MMRTRQFMSLIWLVLVACVSSQTGQSQTVNWLAEVTNLSPSELEFDKVMTDASKDWQRLKGKHYYRWSYSGGKDLGEALPGLVQVDVKELAGCNGDRKVLKDAPLQGRKCRLVAEHILREYPRLSIRYAQRACDMGELLGCLWVWKGFFALANSYESTDHEKYITLLRFTCAHDQIDACESLYRAGLISQAQYEAAGARADAAYQNAHEEAMEEYNGVRESSNYSALDSIIAGLQQFQLQQQAQRSGMIVVPPPQTPTEPSGTRASSPTSRRQPPSPTVASSGSATWPGGAGANAPLSSGLPPQTQSSGLSANGCQECQVGANGAQICRPVQCAVGISSDGDTGNSTGPRSGAVPSNSTVQWANECVKAVSRHDQPCGNPDDISGTISNVCAQRIQAKFCFQRNDLTWDCGQDTLRAGGSTSYWTCHSTGKGIFWGAIDNGQLIAFPNP